MVSHWSLSDSKSPQISRTLLSILADLSNAIVWMVSTCPLISKSFSPCPNPLVTALRAPIIIGITVTFMFYSFLNSLPKVQVLILLFAFFNFTLWSAGTAESTIQQGFSFLLILFG